jgi:hypothetical protein
MLVESPCTYFEIVQNGTTVKYLAKATLKNPEQIYSFCIASDIPVRYYDEIRELQMIGPGETVKKDVVIVG